MLRPTLGTLRLFLHVLAATVWVGGQITLAGLVPGLRDVSASAPQAVARRFSQIAWPAFAILVVTGLWNVASVPRPFEGQYGVTLMVKIAVVALSVMGAWLHTRARSPRALAGWGAFAGLCAVTALFLGVLLAG